MLSFRTSESVPLLILLQTSSRFRYGKDAASTSNLMGDTAKNLALVYIDMRGIGRKALIKRAGKQYLKKTVAQERESVK
jgi:hypothetical protein